jgi:guanylate kinase
MSSLLGNCSKGLLFILSAPAGTGKTTLVQMLTREFPCVVASISYTTRQPRAGEEEGVHYHFISKEGFVQRIAEGEFLEHVELYGDYYGTSRLWVEKQLSQGKHVILVIDTQGAKLLKSTKTISIFIAPPSIEELERRLRLRETDTKASIEKRLLWAKKEMEAQKNYDYLIVNDDLSNAYQVLRSILIAEEHKIR